MPELQVDLGRQLQKRGNSLEYLLEMGPRSGRCSAAENQRTSSMSPLLLDHELHEALPSMANCRRTGGINGRSLLKYVRDLAAF